jgi:small subunit ribosomal protein S21
MLIIEVKKGIEIALKQYKNKVHKVKQVQELRERKEFVKPSVKKRKDILKAKYVQKFKDGLND